MSALTPATSGSDRGLHDELPSGLVGGVIFIALVVAAIGSLGAPLITAVAEDYQVSLDAAQWTLTAPLLVGAVATPLLGRLGSTGYRRRPTVLWTLAVVVAGSVATLLPGGIVVLLVGRGAQGAGLALPALMIATARSHLGPRAPTTIAILAVASTAGIGFGYPIAGLLADAGSVRAAYGFGLAIASAALAVAWRILPREERPTAAREQGIDWPGAVLLSVALVAILLVTSTISLWSTHPVETLLTLVVGLLVLAAWVRVEWRREHPLVDLAALRHPAVAGSNAVMGIAAIGMYLLLTLITRFTQTPAQAGYGFGLDYFQAGLVLVPFSLLGFLSGRLVPRLKQRISPFPIMAASGAVIVAAFGLFALNRSQLAWPVIAMGLLGLGVGGFSAAMPRAILASTPQHETAAAMSLNQVVRSVGFSIGSALGGLVLAAHTVEGTVFPQDVGYTVAAVIGAVIVAAASVLALTLTRVRP